MSFNLTKDFIQTVEREVQAQNIAFIQAQVLPLHPADISEIFGEIDLACAKYIFDQLENEKAAQVLLELGEDQREQLLSDYSSQEIAEELIENLDSDDAAYILSELSEDQKEEVLSYVEDIQQASDIVDILQYEEDTAGAIMAKEMICVREDWPVVECIREMRKQAQETDRVMTIYVIDEYEKLVGTLSLKALLMVSPKTYIRDIYAKEIISVRAKSTKEEVVKIMQKYDLDVMPVVDELGRLIGRITIDDVIDVMKEEAEKDFQLASGYSEVVEATDSIWTISRSRFPWLLVGLFGGILSSRVIGLYEAEIKIYPEMAFFIPLIAAMGGNAGVQSSAIMVRTLSNNEGISLSSREQLLKELKVSLINGIACSSIIFFYCWLFSTPIYLGITVSTALLSVIVFATLFGTFIPQILDRYKIDPALATGPFITTSNDILGLFIYFLIGRVMYVGF